MQWRIQRKLHSAQVFLKKVYLAACNRFVFLCGFLGITVSDVMIKNVLLRQSNTKLSEDAFSFIITFLRKQCKHAQSNYTIIIPNDMYKAFSFIRCHFSGISVLTLDTLGSNIPQTLFLKTNFLYKFTNILKSSNVKFYVNFKNAEWILISTVKSKYSICDDETINTVIANAQAASVNGAFSSKLYVRPNTNDSQVVEEVKSEYFPIIQDWISSRMFGDGPKHIVDLGGHIGAFSVQLAKLLGERIAIHVFEPEPGNFEMITKNIALNNLKTITPHREAVSATSSEGTLFFNPEHRGANQLNRKLSYATKPIPVSVVSFQKVLELFPHGGIDLLKIDIEGSEYATLMSVSDLRVHVKAIIGEAQATDGYKPIDLIRHLESQGYTVEQKGQPDLVIFSAVRN